MTREVDVNAYVMAAVSSIESEVYGVREKVKKQQLTLRDMWKKCCRYYF
jgi:hypothetical protein